jgi:hypothetical protein
MLPPSLRGGGLFEQLFCLSPRPDTSRRGKENPRYRHRAADAWPNKIEVQSRHVNQLLRVGLAGRNPRRDVRVVTTTRRLLPEECQEIKRQGLPSRVCVYQFYDAGYCARGPG